VDHGLYLPAGRDDDLAAWALVLPPSGCFTHLTAAAAYGWRLPPVPADLPVFAAMHDVEARPKRARLRISRHPRPPERLWRQGLPLASPPEVLLHAARDLGLLDLVVLGDSALRRGDCTVPQLFAVCEAGRRGSRTLRRAVRWMDPRAESAWESVLRVLHVACRVPVEPQHAVYDEGGAFVARGDLWLRGTTVLHEYDGAVHRDRSQHRRDLQRERAIGNAGWTRRGYTARDILGAAHVILREADAAIDRPHDPRRIHAWDALLRESLFGPLGTYRLRRRWGLPTEPG
jgi:hypothetical protein